MGYFLDLCHLVGHPTPAETDPIGAIFCFEKGAAKQGGGDGYADVWKRGHFAIEYKGRHKNLDAAYAQLLQYREALENPPLLVTCDLDRIIVHTNFTATAKQVHEISLESLGEPRSLEIIRDLFHDPSKLRPGRTSEAVTTAAAAHDFRDYLKRVYRAEYPRGGNRTRPDHHDHDRLQWSDDHRQTQRRDNDPPHLENHPLPLERRPSTNIAPASNEL